MSIKVESAVKIYEDDEPSDKKIIVSSHWNDNDFVVIKIGKKSATVIASDMIAAIKNAQNNK